MTTISEKIMTNRRKKNIRDKIKDLSKENYITIFDKIIKDTDVYTENKNGIYVNLNNVSDKTLLEIEKYVIKVLQDKKEMEDKIKCKLPISDYSKQNENEIKLSNYEKFIVQSNE